MPAFTGIKYVSTIKYFNPETQVEEIKPTFEFSMSINTCDETKIVVGDRVIIKIEIDGSFSAYNLGNSFEFQTVRLDNVFLSGFITEDLTDQIDLIIDNNYIESFSVNNGIIDYDNNDIIIQANYNYNQSDPGEKISFVTYNKQIKFIIDNVEYIEDLKNTISFGGYTFYINNNNNIFSMDKIYFDLLNEDSIDNIFKLNESFYTLNPSELIQLEINEFVEFIYFRFDEGVAINIDGTNLNTNISHYDLNQIVGTITIRNDTTELKKIKNIYIGSNYLSKPLDSIKINLIDLPDYTKLYSFDVNLKMLNEIALTQFEINEYTNILLIPNIKKKLYKLGKYEIREISDDFTAFTSDIEDLYDLGINIL